ncbi:hypothetical protein OESDEN_13717, partial [Oesophagostomum dentatum]
MDSAGIGEYSGTKESEKKAINDKVMRYFEETIEKREDGYYVRLPYKDDHPQLPNNLALAHMRLRSVLRMLEGKPSLLQEYDKTFKDQLGKGIIEQVDNIKTHSGEILHYLPHQPVITPMKETTKLRIVFDASSHYRDCPSLNDILHQGPLILPEIYAMLIRFRLSKYAIIADVEKAFLQVRLHELDRDATRFLWVRDTNLPPEDDNVITFRFRRVTFGLNVSPFLLAGTILFHLKNYVSNKNLANEIKNNIYVDNLILSAKTQKETCEKAIQARQIFTEMQMNLREFLSNDTTLQSQLPSGTYSNKKAQKVLGLMWNSDNDTLAISCSLQSPDTLTKRLVAHQIASVYDPLGYLVPLLVRAKIFQQKLWLEGYDWDEHLSNDLVKEWTEIAKSVNGFSREFPRRLICESKSHTIILGPEIQAARKLLLKNHQSSFLTHEYKKSMQHSLRLFLDSDGIWRAKGRLANAVNYETNNPIFIAPNTDLSRKIIYEAHGIYHKGIGNTMSEVRQRYWIPKLRQQVRKLVQNCVECRRLNGFPYSYPETTELPSRRVVKGRTFQHIGLDFFDLPSIKDGNDEVKLYGCIFTCTTTRLIHLELVKSMSTTDFLNALRRFFSRRGVPDTITCDNAPTFLLTAQILATTADTTTENPVTVKIASHEIRWYHITPYAPWQGGFYERLIKSIKHSLYKALRAVDISTFDNMMTILTEIEACLNSRPLTYQSDMLEDFNTIRPIDFVQKDIILTFPLENIKSNDDDPEYLTPEMLFQLRTRKQAEEALESSYKITQRFWNIWQEQYILSLREQHTKMNANKRFCTTKPEVGAIVLIADPVMPRNKWKMARISKLNEGSDGQIREAELVTSTKRKVKRPINLLIPLELNCAEANDSQNVTDDNSNISSSATNHPYNLRPRKPISYNESSLNYTYSPTMIDDFPSNWTLLHTFFLSLVTSCITVSPNSYLTCTNKGVQVNLLKNQSFEICAESLCKLYEEPSNNELIKFSPEITSHNYTITLKWTNEDHLLLSETTCPALDFCENLTCWLCTSLLFNPECWPQGAILIFTLILYISLLTLYFLVQIIKNIFVPITTLISLTKTLFFLTFRLYQQILQLCQPRYRNTATKRFAAALALSTFVLTVAKFSYACQEVNILDYHTTICTTTNGRQICNTKLFEILKLNTFHQEACIRLIANESLIANVKLRWKSLYLLCDQQTLYFTRSTKTLVTHSKRCPHMGSCTGEKCAKVKSTDLLPELIEGNRSPGRTGCLESCGGPGCDCFYISSGCLFYRIYAKPENNDIFEIFKCARWNEE